MSDVSPVDERPTTRRAVVSYPAEASPNEKQRALLDGIRECASELVELGFKADAIRECEQVANDIETEML